MGTPLVPPSNARPPDSPSSSSKISPSHPVTSSPILRPRKSFCGNTYGIPRKCCKQKTYGKAKSFTCTTYKKQGGGGPALRIRQGCASCVRQRRRSRRIFLRPHSFALPCTKSVSQFLYNQAVPHSFSKLPGCRPTISILGIVGRTQRRKATFFVLSFQQLTHSSKFRIP